MTDILALSNWAVLSVEHGDELIIKRGKVIKGGLIKIKVSEI